MRKYFALFIAVIISLTLLVGCNKETPKVDLPETLDTVGNIDTAPPATEAEETVGSVDTTPPVIDTLPIILTKEIDALPDSVGAAIFMAWFSGANGTYYYFDSGADTLEFYRVDYSKGTAVYYRLTLTLPDGYSKGKIHKAETTSGGDESDGIRFIVEAEYNRKKLFLDYTLTADKGSGLYVLSSVRRTTEEEFTPVLGERTLEFVTHDLYLQVGVNVSLAVPSYWELGHHGSVSAFFNEDDTLNIFPRDTEIQRGVFFETDQDFDTMLREAQSDVYPVSDGIFSGTTAAGHEYKGFCKTFDEASQYIFSIVTDREMYTLKVWSQPEYDVGVDFFNDVVIPVVESFSVEYHEKETITDIADWDTLPWVEKPYDYRKRAPNAYNFIYDMVSGESKYPELNGLGIEDYSITLLENNSNETTLRFTFTVTGNSLPETLPPGTYTKIVYNGMSLVLYDDKKPETSEEYSAAYKSGYGLDIFGDYSAVQAVHRYLSFPLDYLIPNYGEWPADHYSTPYPYICSFYGNHLEISFDEMQRLLSEKFGINIEKPTESCSLYRCEYNADTDTVYYADTRGYNHIHRFVDVREDGGTTYVTVQFYADYLYLIPSYKIVYEIGEGEVFLGCEVISEGYYKPHNIGW